MVDAWSEFRNVLEQPNGARFYKCALQVNPYEYVVRHNKTNIYPDEDSYNHAMVKACIANEINAVAITDHYRVFSASKLQEAMKEAGIYVFPGFEAVTKDGVHFLCLFDGTKDLQLIDRYIGQCGVHDESSPSPIGRLDSEELLSFITECNGLCVAARINPRRLDTCSRY